MSYVIERGAAPATPELPQRQKTQERLAMEQLAVGDAFTITTFEAWERASWARRHLVPRKFTIIKVARVGWQVRRTL